MRALGNESRGASGSPVEHVHPVAAVQEPPRHCGPHPTQSEERYGYHDQVARIATVTGTRDARSAGRSPAMTPMPNAQPSPNSASAGVTAM